MRYENFYYTYKMNNEFKDTLAIKYLIKEQELDINNYIVIIGVVNDIEVLDIPEEINGIKVCGIDCEAFCNLKNIKLIKLPSTIERIIGVPFANNSIIEYKNKQYSLSRFMEMYQKEKQEKIYHQLQGFIKIDGKWNKVINVIKKSKNRIVAICKIKEKFSLTDEQAIAILDSKINHISILGTIDLKQKLKELENL